METNAEDLGKRKQDCIKETEQYRKKILLSQKEWIRPKYDGCWHFNIWGMSRYQWKKENASIAKEAGHISKDCPEKNKRNEEKKVFEGKELHTYIQGMTEEEKEKFYAEAEGSGF